MPSARSIVILLGCSLVTLVLGSVHAFSVLLAPMEEAFGESRALASLTYSLALVFLTIAVLFGHRVYGKLPPAIFVMVSVLLAALGCVLAAAAASIQQVWLGYGLIFGTANGLGYGFALQMAAQANPERRALAMGFVTAAYAGGATLAPFVLARGVESGGHAYALIVLAGCIALVGMTGALVLKATGAQFVSSSSGDAAGDAGSGSRLIIHLWIAYGTGVAAGLMVIGHASGILKATGADDGLTLLAPVLVAFGNMCGGVIAGWSADRLGLRLVLSALPLVSAAGLALVLITSNPMLALFGLTAAGFAYGAIIAVYPAAVSYLFGPIAGIKAYGRVFTAWGTFGLLLPWLAGYLFDRTGGYDAVLMIAAVVSTLSAIAAFRLPEAKPTHA